MNANSFQLKAAVTEGKDVMPKSTENAYATTPFSIKTKYQISGLNNKN